MKDPNGPASLYRLGDEDGNIYYIGVSSNFHRRYYSHDRNIENRLSGWLSLVTAAQVEDFPTRMEALAAEASAIRDEAPWYNRLGSHTLRSLPGSPTPEEAWESMARVWAYRGLIDPAEASADMPPQPDSIVTLRDEANWEALSRARKGSTRRRELE